MAGGRGREEVGDGGKRAEEGIWGWPGDPRREGRGGVVAAGRGRRKGGEGGRRCGGAREEEREGERKMNQREGRGSPLQRGGCITHARRYSLVPWGRGWRSVNARPWTSLDFLGLPLAFLNFVWSSLDFV